MNVNQVFKSFATLNIRRPWAIVLVIMFVFGRWGLGSDYAAYFRAFTPWHLSFVFVVWYFHQTEKPKHFNLLLASMYVMSFGVECIGVNSGLIFGTYAYGQSLGLKIFNTPLMIGVLWVQLVFGVGHVFNGFCMSTWLKSLLAAGALTALDGLIEPFATVHDFWTWQGGVPPFQNYLAWFILSFMLFYLYFSFIFVRANRLSMVVMGLYLWFFLV